MAKTYFGFAVADGMFPSSCTVSRRPATVDEAKELIEAAKAAGELVVTANASHEATVVAMKERFGIDVPIPETPPRVTLTQGDVVVVMSVRGLPRLTDNRHYTEEEVAQATFVFGVWTVEEA